jgi:hypothetical protein
VTFATGRGIEWREVATVDQVYCDQLRHVFEKHTGLATSL